MPPHKDNDETPDSERENTATQPTGLLDQLQILLKALAEIDREEGGHRRGSGQSDRGASRIDYEYTVSIGLGQSDHSPGTGASPSRSHSEQRSYPRRSVGDSIAIETREGTSDDERIIIADLPGVADDDVVDAEIAADEPELILWVNGTEIKRVPLGQSEVRITDITVNNQVLEIRASHASDSSRGETT
ncbi:protein gvpH 1 [Halobellus salinus]|uniref:Protein gvpH 1 n=1 Tax=Halobellus salinus TaxID=931585 RepID=A0A830ESF0_9EURY|nr:gas vesicle protein GvpH [Halobellus salinus]GGJ05385.1 protein gvpH 1 [Halobellus salinus]SMP23321.1 GvpH protein [Halobellus salinus]